MTEIIQHPAQQVTVNTEETFDQYKKRIKETRTEIRAFKDGMPIAVDSAMQYSFLMLGMERLLTPEEFAAVYMAVMSAIDQMEKAGVLPEELVKTVSTPFDATPPVIPDRFREEAGDGVELVVHFVCNTGFEIVKEYPPDEAVEEEDADTDSD